MRIDHIRACFVYGGRVMPSRRIGSGVGKYNAENPKQDSKRFSSIIKTIHFAQMSFISGENGGQCYIHMSIVGHS